MKRRNLKILINKSGRGTEDYRITIPNSWIKSMNLSREDRNVVMSFDNNKIIIEKGEIDMYKVIKYYDVYRKDLFEKYGSKDYRYYGDYTITTEENLGDFTTEKEAKEFAKNEYEKQSQKFSVSGNDIYLVRYDVLNLEDEDDAQNICSFGLTLEEYKKELD